MSAAFVQGVSASVDNSASLASPSMNTTSGNTILAGTGITIFYGPFVSLTDNDGGAGFSQADVQVAAAGFDEARSFYKAASTKSGYVATLNATLTGGQSELAIAVEEASGIDASTPLDKTAKGTGTTVTTAALSQNDEYAFGVAICHSSTSGTVSSSGWSTDQYKGATSQDILTGYHVEAAGAAQTFTASFGGVPTRTAIICATYKASGGASFDGALMAAIGLPQALPLQMPPKIVASGMIPPNIVN